jgi:xyloglucan-specific exo-beta-1,4-glucanase
MPILQKLSSIATANLVAFGKPAGGSAPITWYLYGAINAGDTIELFTSINGGASWTQINDANHQWGGGVNSLSGDMRTFGTVYVGTNGRGIILGTSQ